MSAATKRKHVTREVTEDLIVPQEGQLIVRIVAGRGNNLHEVEDVDGNRFLVSMPTKFRRNVWIKRDQYVMCERIEEGDKVKAEIIHVLYPDNIRHIQSEGFWPFPMPAAPAGRSGIQTSTNSSGGAYSIDKDMLPPSDDDDESDSDDDKNEEDVVDDSDGSSSPQLPHRSSYNPNHNRGIFSSTTTAATTNYPSSASTTTVQTSETADSTTAKTAADLAHLTAGGININADDNDDGGDDVDAGSSTPTEAMDAASSRQVHVPFNPARSVVPFVESKFARTWLRPAVVISSPNPPSTSVDDIRSMRSSLSDNISGDTDIISRNSSSTVTENPDILENNPSSFPCRSKCHSHLNEISGGYHQHRYRQQAGRDMCGSTTTSDEFDGHLKPAANSRASRNRYTRRFSRFSAGGDVPRSEEREYHQQHMGEQQKYQLIKYRRHKSGSSEAEDKEDSSPTAAESNTESVTPAAANGSVYDFTRFSVNNMVSSGGPGRLRQDSTGSSSSSMTTPNRNEFILESPLTSRLRNSTSSYNSQQSTSPHENSGTRKSVHFSPSLDSTQISEPNASEHAPDGTSTTAAAAAAAAGPSTSFHQQLDNSRGSKRVDIKAVLKKLEIEYETIFDTDAIKGKQDKIKKSRSPSKGRVTKRDPSPKKPLKVALFSFAKPLSQFNHANLLPKESIVPSPPLIKKQSVQSSETQFYDDQFFVQNLSNHRSREPPVRSDSRNPRKGVAESELDTSLATNQSDSKTKYYSFTQEPSPKTVSTVSKVAILPPNPPHRSSGGSHWSNFCHITAKSSEPVDWKPKKPVPPPPPYHGIISGVAKSDKALSIKGCRKAFMEPIEENPEIHRSSSPRLGRQTKIQNTWTQPKYLDAQTIKKPGSRPASSSLVSTANNRRQSAANKNPGSSKEAKEDSYLHEKKIAQREGAAAATGRNLPAGARRGTFMSSEKQSFWRDDELKIDHSGGGSRAISSTPTSSNRQYHQKCQYPKEFSWENRRRFRDSTEVISTKRRDDEEVLASSSDALGNRLHYSSSAPNDEVVVDDERRNLTSSAVFSSTKHRKKLERSPTSSTKIRQLNTNTRLANVNDGTNGGGGGGLRINQRKVEDKINHELSSNHHHYQTKNSASLAPHYTRTTMSGKSAHSSACGTKSTPSVACGSESKLSAACRNKSTCSTCRYKDDVHAAELEKLKKDKNRRVKEPSSACVLLNGKSNEDFVVEKREIRLFGRVISQKQQLVSKRKNSRDIFFENRHVSLCLRHFLIDMRVLCGTDAVCT